MEWGKEILLAHMASRGTQQRSKYAGSVLSARAAVQDGNHRPSRYPQALTESANACQASCSLHNYLGGSTNEQID